MGSGGCFILGGVTREGVPELGLWQGRLKGSVCFRDTKKWNWSVLVTSLRWG